MSADPKSDKPPPTEGVALLMIDMQEPFLKVVDPDHRLRRRCRFAVSAASLLGIPVAFTEQVPEKLGKTVPSLGEPAPDAPVFQKSAFSAFGAPGLSDWLAEREIVHLLLAGIETAVCVYQTARDARRNAVAVTLLSDATAGRRGEDTRQVMRFLEMHQHAAILPTESVFYSLVHDAAHPLFRDFTRLVKAADQAGDTADSHPPN